jgi:hypothetical protein
MQSFLHLEDFMWKLSVTGTSASKYSREILGPNIARIVFPLNVSFTFSPLLPLLSITSFV